MTIEVTWRSGRVSRLAQVMPNDFTKLRKPLQWLPHPGRRATRRRRQPSSRRSVKYWRIPITKSRMMIFTRQPLLPPRKPASQVRALAGGISTENGHEDLLIGSGKGGSLAIYLGDGQGAFVARIIS